MNLEQVEVKREIGKSSVNGHLNNSSSVNPLPLPEMKEFDSLRHVLKHSEHVSGETTYQDRHGPPVLGRGLPPGLNLNHNAYSIFPRIHVRRESMARGTAHFNFARA